jgi:hypothetical protein
MSLSTVKTAGAPLNVTLVASVNRTPEIVTGSPGLPAIGVKPLMTGPTSAVNT